jgi:acetolactate synthase I/II/III large subunit
MELEMAVRLKSNVVHVIWVDNMYNIIEIQEIQKYKRRSGAEFGPIDFKAYAESFGAKGFAVESADTLRATSRAAMEVEGPAVIAIPVDYSDNPKLMEPLRSDYLIEQCTCSCWLRSGWQLIGNCAKDSRRSSSAAFLKC